MMGGVAVSDRHPLKVDRSSDPDVNSAAVFGKAQCLGQQFWHQMDHAQRGDFDAAKRRLTMTPLRQMMWLNGSGTSYREIAVVLQIAHSRAQNSGEQSRSDY